MPRMGDTNTTTAFGNLNLKDIANSLGSSTSRRTSPPPPSPFAGAPAFNQDNQSSFQDTSSAGGELSLWACLLPACARPFVGMLAFNQASHSSFQDNSSLLEASIFAMIEGKHGSLQDTGCTGGEQTAFRRAPHQRINLQHQQPSMDIAGWHKSPC